MYEGRAATSMRIDFERATIIAEEIHASGDDGSRFIADAKDKTKWVFKLRSGVKFHDGSSFNADAVVWNVQKVLDKSAAHFDPSQIGVTTSRMPTLRSARKIDDLTVELTTSEPDSTDTAVC